MELIDLSCTLKTFDNTLSRYGITDPNFCRNSEELVNIFIKKTYLNIRNIIENILKTEREKKTDHLSKEYITIGPAQLFNIICSTFDLIKSRKIKVIFENMIELTRECIIQYLIGVDILIKVNFFILKNFQKQNLDIEKEFLIAIANNSINLNNNIDTIIENILSYDILTEDEIRAHLSKKKISSVITMLTNYSIFRFVNETSESLIASFDEQFINIDMKKILTEALTNFEKYEEFMFTQTRSKMWIEILRTCCFYYIRRLIFGKNKKPKTIEEIIKKIKDDQRFLLEVFLNKIGENTIKENILMLEKILEFMETSADMISLACYSLRENLGMTCNIDMIRALLEYKVDFSAAEKKSAFLTCKEVLENYKSDDKDNGNNPLVDYILLERKNMNSRVSKSEGLEGINEENMENARKLDNIRRGTVNISDFLGVIGEIPDGVDEKKDEEDEVETVNFVISKKKDENTVDADVVYSGVMQKKSNSK